ncbi:MAG: ABC transporter ATP-binding protein [Oscillospiraceae bacterium]|jgi:oligopeptide transport system ATP-binding protein|nr:ABC transporter ATP-binding protein [Oscillospiraceae bacterium]
MPKLLELEDLRVSFHTYAGEAQALRGVNLTLDAGDTLAIVGESGCGKTVTAQSVMRLYPKGAADYKGGSIRYKGEDLLTLSERQMRRIRGREISMVFQDPMTSLNPTVPVGKQIMEGVLKNGSRESKRVTRRDARLRALELLEGVGIADPETRMGQYPHNLSGGMRQRVMIAIAMSCSPDLLIADEPTTALDVTVQAQILELMKSLQSRGNTSIIVITHNMGVVANIARKVAVMYGGVVVERGTVEDIFFRPRHPYAWGLLRSVFRLNKPKDEPLTPIDGTPPELIDPLPGCPFAERCAYTMRVCASGMPPEFAWGEARACRCWLYGPGCPVIPAEWEEYSHA